MEYKVEGKHFNLFGEYLTFTNILLDDNHWNISNKSLFGKGCIFGSKIQTTTKNYFTVHHPTFNFHLKDVTDWQLTYNVGLVSIIITMIVTIICNQYR